MRSVDGILQIAFEPMRFPASAQKISRVVLSCLLTLCGSPALRAQAFLPPTSSPTGFWNSTFVVHNDHTLGMDYPAQAYLGIRLSGTSWNTIETARGNYNWTPIDNYTANGGNLLYTFQNTPSWANSSGLKYLPPDNLQDYYDFVTALMIHICPTSSTCKIKNFEAWNEFSSNGYWDTNYATLATMSAHAAKIVKQYCTNCQFGAGSVSAGGIGWNDVETNTRNAAHPHWTYYDEALTVFLDAWKADVAADSTLPEPDFISWHAYSAKGFVDSAHPITPQTMPEYSYSGNGLGTGGDNGSSYCTTANQSRTTNQNCVDSILTQAITIGALTSGSTHGVSGKPIWVTEGGFNGLYSMANSDNHNDAPEVPCHAGGVPICTQDIIRSAYLARWLIMLHAHSVARAYWYAWDEPCYGTLFGSTSTGADPVCTFNFSSEKVAYHVKTPAGVAWDQAQLWMNGATAPASCSENRTTHVYSCTITRTNPAGYVGLMVWYTPWLQTTSYTPPAGYTQYRTLDGTVTSYSGGSITLGAQPIIFEKKS